MIEKKLSKNYKSRLILSDSNLVKINGHFYIEDKETKERTPYPIKGVEEIYFLSKSELDSYDLCSLLDNNILIHFFNHNDRYCGSLFPNSKEQVNKSGFVLIEQVKTFSDDEKRLYLAKQITKGHFLNALCNLKNYSVKNELDTFVSKIENVKSINELMGIEGNFQKAYYQLFNDIVKNQKYFKFVQRSKRPPLDLINVMISYLNSFIYSTCLSQINKTEMNPSVSFLHEPNYRHLSLHLDIAEIFKPIITDNIIFKLINSNKITNKSFYKENGLYKLNKDSRELIFFEIQDFLLKVVKVGNGGLTYKQIIIKEVNKIKKYVVEGGVYEPYLQQ